MPTFRRLGSTTREAWEGLHYGWRRVMSSALPLVVHVVPQDIARGAQKYAEMMSRELDGVGRHELVTIFDGGVGFLRSTVSLDVKSGALRTVGFEPRAFLALRRVLEETRPDLVIAHGGEALKYCAFGIPNGAKLIYLRIGISSDKVSNPLRRFFQWRLLSRPHAIVAVSGAVRDELIDCYELDPDSVRVIPNARDETVFTPECERSLREPPVLIFVGHFTSSKRPQLFADVVEDLRRRNSTVKAKMVGNGPLLGKMRRQAAVIGMDVLGVRDDVPELLKNADVFLFTSRSEGEGMPGVLIEAALAGLPIVTTDVPGARDVVEDGTTGFVVPDGDRVILVDRVESLLSDPDLRHTMGVRARKRAMGRFTFAVTGRLWEGLFRELL